MKILSRAFAVLLFTGSFFVAGCSDTTYQNANDLSCQGDTCAESTNNTSPPSNEPLCDPLENEACICLNDAREICDPRVEEVCDCSIRDTEEEGDAVEEPMDPTSAYSYLMIQDVANPVAGDYPGADLDALALIKREGTTHYASNLEPALTHVARNNAAPDPAAILGPPDTGCEVLTDKFVSLGGLDYQIVVNFFTPNERVSIENGDRIEVYELGRTFCPHKNYDDDPARILISATSDDLASFVEVGQVGDGNYTITVSGL